ncbi:type II toxin-antitoxin system RelE/ParE family toxin [Sphingosinicella soli]|uniref:Toxin ParE1/3/4 n=1 Tax=Sphingosinicella soli TaxID=333708 RepID=A0A7W7AXV9_9SPHN|nr:type II toxin-antitoxin system RelE/ParE family toxin [Sphingosinicella soli]MBB4630400.1 toxin ParE1/3/4 [Sphingosinicella soli]
MADIVLSPLAAYDLEQILDWSVDQFGDSVAFAYMTDIEAAIALLGEYPEAGEVISSIRPPVRAYPCRRHRIIYDLHADEVLIVRVLHASQSVKLALN